jgi:very-short-patch-repair endonuclease
VPKQWSASLTETEDEADDLSMDNEHWRHIAARQAGVVHRDQLESELSPSQVKRLVADEVIRRLHPQVFVLVGVPISFRRAAWAAQLWSRDGALSGLTAARLLELDAPRSPVIEVSMPRRARPPSGVVVYRKSVGPRDLSTVQGLRVTTMPRSVIDCARHLPDQHLDVLLDSAIRSGMAKRLFLERAEELCVPGRPGVGTIRRIIAERETEQGLTGSAFERAHLRSLKRAGLPLPISQWPVLEEGFSAFIDFAYPEHGVAIEADGYRWHSGRVAWEADRRRTAELSSRGWRVIQVTWIQLKYDRDAVVSRIRRALARPPLVQLRS